MKPPFAYYGGKGRLASWIADLAPPHRVYVEPFAGSAAVLLAKRPAVHEVINDVSGDIVCFFRVLRDRPLELERACRLTPYSRDEFVAAAAPVVDDLERARHWWVTVNQGFNKSARAKNGWSSSVMAGAGEAVTVRNRIDRFEGIARRLADVTIENRDALDVIDAYGKHDALIYVDPPYLAATRSDQISYPNEFATPEQHRALAERLHATPAAVILSGYPSPLYEEMYSGWHRIDRRVVRRASNRASAPTPHAMEVLWANVPLGAQQCFEVSG